MIYDLSDYTLEREITITGHNFRKGSQSGHTVRIYRNSALSDSGNYILEHHYDDGTVLHTRHRNYNRAFDRLEDALRFGSVIAMCN